MANAILTPTAVTRGAQVVACDAARRLAVQTHEAEHQLEMRLTPGKPEP